VRRRQAASKARLDWGLAAASPALQAEAEAGGGHVPCGSYLIIPAPRAPQPSAATGDATKTSLSLSRIFCRDGEGRGLVSSPSAALRSGGGRGVSAETIFDLRVVNGSDIVVGGGVGACVSGLLVM
jgi:hypothetical protein